MSTILQAGGVPLELLLILVIGVILFIIPLVVSAYIYRDAARRDSEHALAWASGSFFCALLGQFMGGVVFWLFYAVVRDEVGPGDAPSGDIASGAD